MVDHHVRRVLVADDEHDIADLLALNLEMHGFDVQTVYDGEAARDAVIRTLPDLIVLDLMMPKMDGLEVVTALKAHRRTSEIPIVMLTAKASDSDVWAGWQAGADYYMTKPFDFDELLRYIAYLQDPARTLV